MTKTIKMTGRYATAETKKVFKSAQRIFVRVYEEDEAHTDRIYTTVDGYALFAMSEYEYNELVRPITIRDAGNYKIDKGAANPYSDYCDTDLRKILEDAAKECSDTESPCEIFPGVFKPFSRKGKNPIQPVYNAENSLVVLLDSGLLAPVQYGNIIRISGEKNPAVAFFGGAFAMVMPIRAEAKYTKTVRAYFRDAEPAEDAPSEATAKIEKLQKQLIESTARLSAAANRERELLEQIEAMRTATPATAPEAPAEKPNAETVAEKFNGMEGVEVQINGATTRAPVIWLTGNVKPHAAEIKSAGGKWSAKKNAFYICVA